MKARKAVSKTIKFYKASKAQTFLTLNLYNKIRLKKRTDQVIVRFVYLLGGGLLL